MRFAAQLARDHEVLTQSIGSPAHNLLLAQLKSNWWELGSLDNWSTFVNRIEARNWSASLRNSLLTPVVSAMQEQPSQLLADVLTAAFWSRLRAIHRRTKSWDKDQDERWSNIAAAFLTIIRRPKLLQATDIAKAGFWRTFRELHYSYQRVWRARSRSRNCDANIISDASAKCDSELTKIDLKDELTNVRTHLDRQHGRGVLDDLDMALITGTRLDGRSMAEVAKELQLSYDTAKCRRQRAERRLGQSGCRVLDLWKLRSNGVRAFVA